MKKPQEMLTRQYGAYHPHRNFPGEGEWAQSQEPSLNANIALLNDRAAASLEDSPYYAAAYKEREANAKTDWNPADFGPERYDRPHISELQKELLQRAAAALQEIFPESVGHPPSNALTFKEHPEHGPNGDYWRICNAESGAWTDLKQSFDAQDFAGPDDCREKAELLVGKLIDPDQTLDHPLLPLLQRQLTDAFVANSGSILYTDIQKILEEGTLYQENTPERSLDFITLTDLTAANRGEVPPHFLALKIEENLGPGLDALNNYAPGLANFLEREALEDAKELLNLGRISLMLRQEGREKRFFQEDFEELMPLQQQLNHQIKTYLTENPEQFPYSEICAMTPEARQELEAQIQESLRAMEDPYLRSKGWKLMRQAEDQTKALHKPERGDPAPSEKYMRRAGHLAHAVTLCRIAAAE